MTNRLAPAIPHAALQLMMLLAVVVTAAVLATTGAMSMLVEAVADHQVLGNGQWHE